MYSKKIMNHIYLIKLVVLKRPGFQSQKYGMPTNRTIVESFVIVSFFLQ